MKRLIFILFIVLLNTKIYSSGPHIYSKYILQPNSVVGFNGNSTINTFSCSSALVYGEGKGITSTDTMVYLENEAKVALYVESFDCGSDLMNEDLYRTLKSKKNPLIQFELLKVESIEAVPEDVNTCTVVTTGNMLVAGIEKKQEIIFTIENLVGSEYRVTGSKKLSMTEFAITPPTALFGLIKVDDTLEVVFDLVVTVQNGIVKSN